MLASINHSRILSKTASFPSFPLARSSIFPRSFSGEGPALESSVKILNFGGIQRSHGVGTLKHKQSSSQWMFEVNTPKKTVWKQKFPDPENHAEECRALIAYQTGKIRVASFTLQLKEDTPSLGLVIYHKGQPNVAVLDDTQQVREILRSHPNLVIRDDSGHCPALRCEKIGSARKNPYLSHILYESWKPVSSNHLDLRSKNRRSSASGKSENPEESNAESALMDREYEAIKNVVLAAWQREMSEIRMAQFGKTKLFVEMREWWNTVQKEALLLRESKK